MAKRVRYHVIDVATGRGWSVVLLYDSEALGWVVAWDSPKEAMRREIPEDQGRPFAQQVFEAARDEIAQQEVA